ncbi:hypothetical protein IJH01_01790 [Candidatus Saccharibacteria bacterium]|nr:hypothetical protein [Candidatus Saccharibacteria bacterium]
MTDRTEKDNESSIVEIERRIAEIGASSKAKTKANASERKRLQSLLNKTYAEYKRKVMEAEQTNFSHLILLRSTKGFHKMFGNSMVFYAYEIAPKLGVEARVHSDSDYEAKSEQGMCSIANIEDFEKTLGKLKIERTKTKDKSGNIVIFKLPWKYSEEELVKLTEHNEYMVGKYNHVVMANNTTPLLYTNTNELLKACYENVRRLEPVARETMGNMIIVVVAEMLRIYIEMTNGRIIEEKALKEMRMRLNKVKSQVKILVDQKLWNTRVYARIGETIIKIQGIIDIKLGGKSKNES